MNAGQTIGPQMNAKAQICLIRVHSRNLRLGILSAKISVISG